MRLLIWTSGIVAALGLAALILFTGSPDTTLAARLRAEQALDRARKANAQRYATEQYRRAEELRSGGLIETARQKGRLPRLRDYSLADSLLAASAEEGRRALECATEHVKDQRSRASEERAAVRAELAQWRDALQGTIEWNRARRHLDRADLACRTGSNLLESGEYEAARIEFSEGAAALRKLADVMEEYANEEAERLPVWRRWVKETVQRSRAGGGYAVIVDKSRHTAWLIRGGQVKRSFACDLGHNPSRQKRFAGDGATPEGTYRVTAVKGNGSSKYYKALLLDYPNPDDRARFARDKSRGVISRNARIGGLIEIHGHGGTGSDWTNGCVALSDPDMDILMRHAKAGTPVTIVRRSDMWP
jgi:hypothetical protein